MGTRIDSIAVVSGGLRRRHSARRLADAAARACLTDANVAASDVDLLVNAGMYRDGNLGEPALAALIQEDIDANPGDPPVGGPGTFSFDVANGSCGVLTGLQLVDGLLATGTAGRALVVASDANPGRGMTRTFPFGATGGAALCDWDDATQGFTGFRWAVHPEFAELLVADVRFDGHRNVLDVREAPEFAARAAICGADVAAKLLADHGLTTCDVDAVIACPLSHGFVAALADAMDLSREQIVDPPSRGAHTAALLISLRSVLHDPDARSARTLLFVAAGAGITIGTALYRR
jgi:3-oxoacyl-[acyl-carrier-protein] synthase III